MPNHVTNIIYVSGNEKTINKYFSLVKSEPATPKDEQRAFDFEKIIPMPKHIFRGNLGPKEEAQYGKENCWYEWSINNWGTKWNCYNISIDDDGGICFDTAWATPIPIFEALSKRFKSLKFEVHYADEDMGNNCGIITLKGGKVIDHWEPPTEDEAMDFACEIKGYDPREEN